MAKKKLELNIKNVQIAKALDLEGLKEKLAKKKTESKPKPKKPSAKSKAKKPKETEPTTAEKGVQEEAQPRIRARSKSVFTEESKTAKAKEKPAEKEVEEQPSLEEQVPATEKVKEPEAIQEVKAEAPQQPEKEEAPPPVKLGPTGKHVKDFLPPKPKKEKGEALEEAKQKKEKTPEKHPPEKKEKAGKFKEFRDFKPVRRQGGGAGFDARDRQGLRGGEEEVRWRKKRPMKQQQKQEDLAVVRPTSLHVRLPISIKDLGSEMKRKASELISKLFMQGVVATINDSLEDETTVQLLGHEFGCEISIDTSEEERIRITDKTIKEEILEADAAQLKMRPPVVAFMGHVDHGKTSLIDTIRKSNITAGESGDITQHIGAFRCSTNVGDITILDTPGHEAFSAMRARGADVTDIVVLVVAGDEGFRQQTEEAIQHAKAAGVTIVVAINKCDKPNFNAETVYRQLADHELLPESWGGQTITINCSAVTGEGIPQLLEMLALQAEILELKAHPATRARGTVLESELHKGLGNVATILVQNGTLRLGDALIFGQFWGRVKTMRDEFGHDLTEADPSTPVAITGLSGLPEAGQEFIVLESEKEARDIAETRMEDFKRSSQMKKLVPIENLFQQVAESPKKVLNIVLRADVQGSLEALKVALLKIESEKVELNIIFSGIGEVSESDVELAAASKAIVLGFHSQVESHADALAKQLGVQVRLHDIIYHAIDDIKSLMEGLLDKIAQETEKGKLEVRAVFKSSQYGTIAGCYVTEGMISRGHYARIIRNGEMIWKGPIASLRRVKEDVREVKKGLECGVVLTAFNDIMEGDIIEAYEITYISQKL